jgi:hypothetical protein
MAKPYSDDLPRRILQCCNEGKQTQEEIAQPLRAKRLLRWRNCCAQETNRGQADISSPSLERKSKFTLPIREWLQSWLKSQPNLALTEVQNKARGASTQQSDFPLDGARLVTAGDSHEYSCRKKNQGSLFFASKSQLPTLFHSRYEVTPHLRCPG